MLLDSSVVDGVGEILFYGEIGDGGIMAPEFLQAVTSLGDVSNIVLRVHSYGGDVYEAVTMYNILKNHPASVHCIVEGAAMSAASFLVMAGDRVSMEENAIFMIHNPWMAFAGNASEFRTQADAMDKVADTIRDMYASRTGIDLKQLEAWLDAETYFTAAETVDAGFANEVLYNKTEADVVDTSGVLNHWSNCPAALIKKPVVAVEESPEPVVEESPEPVVEEPPEPVVEESHGKGNRVKRVAIIEQFND